MRKIGVRLIWSRKRHREAQQRNRSQKRGEDMA